MIQWKCVILLFFQTTVIYVSVGRKNFREPGEIYMGMECILHRGLCTYLSEVDNPVGVCAQMYFDRIPWREVGRFWLVYLSLAQKKVIIANATPSSNVPVQRGRTQEIRLRAEQDKPHRWCRRDIDGPRSRAAPLSPLGSSWSSRWAPFARRCRFHRSTLPFSAHLRSFVSVNSGILS